MLRFIIVIISVFLLSSCSTTKTTDANVIPQDTIAKKDITAPSTTAQVNIALIAPLDKENERIGSNIVQAAQLAIEDSNNQDINLTIINSDLLNSAPQQLLSTLNEHNIQFIVGPLYGKDTVKLMNLIKDKNIPVLSLSNDSSIKYDSLLIMGISPDSQTKTITDYAISQGTSSFSLILPENKLGHIINDAIEDIISKKSGITFSANWYDPTSQEDAEKTINTLVEFIDKQTPNQAIFMPQGDKNLVFLDKALLKHSLHHVQLIGLQSWDNSAALHLPALNGAILLRKDLSNHKFEEKYTHTFGNKANNLDMITYESLLMLINMHNDGLTIDKHSIISYNNYQNIGKYSSMVFDSNGQVIYNLPIAKIQNQQFIVVENNPIR